MATLIRLRCKNQKLSYITKPIIASGDFEVDTVSFDLNETWDGYRRTAVFYRNVEDAFHVFMNDENTCTIPHEVLEDPGAMYIGIFGIRDGKTLTSNMVVCNIDRGAIISIGRVSDPTPDVYAQIISMIEAGMLKGDTGDPGVYVGSGEMPEGYNIQIDPEGNEVFNPVLSVNGVKPDKNGNVEIEAGGGSGITDAEKTLILNLFRNAAYTANMSATFAQLEALWSGSGNEGGEGGGNEGGETPDIPVDPDTPEEPDIPEVTLTSISATYSGGDVEVGTDVSKLKGVTVIAKYSDGTTASVSGYTLSGTIAEGANTITVHYKGLTATFAVTGFAVKETYTVSYNLTDVTADRTVSSVTEGANLTVMLILPENHQLSNVIVTMGGVDVTSSVRNGNIITLTNVNGNIVITASSEEVQYVETFSKKFDAVWLYEDDGKTQIRVVNYQYAHISPRIAVEPSVVHVKLTNNSTSNNGNLAAIGVARCGGNIAIPTNKASMWHTVMAKTSVWGAGRSEEFDYTVPAGYHLVVVNGELDMEITGNIITRELENEYEFVTAVPNSNWSLYTGAEATEETLLMSGKPTYMSATPFVEDTVVNIHVHNPTDASVNTAIGTTHYTLIAAYGDGTNAVGFNAIRTNSAASNVMALPSGRDMYDVEFTVPAGQYLVTSVPPSCMFVKKIS